nr:immunoglobulin heavy chain junction region [Mus musculus]
CARGDYGSSYDYW